MASTSKPFDQSSVQALNQEIGSEEPQEILRWAAAEFQPGLSLACSFGGPSGMVLLDMVMKVDPLVEVFYLDTDFLFPESYHLRDICEARYSFKTIGYKSLLTPEAQAEVHGEELWLRNPDQCCDLRKVEPNARALDGKTAWISGMRSDQSATRKEIGVVEWDAKFNLVKLNPLASWTERQVWSYIAANDVPYNELHNHDYPSIGCTHCTKPVRAGEDLRSGRWQGFEKEECGIQEGTLELPSS